MRPWRCDFSPMLGTRCRMLDSKQLILIWTSHLLVSVNPFPLRRMAVFLKSVNKDSLPVYNIPFESHWTAYLRIDISSYEGGSHFERNCSKMRKSKTCQLLNILGIPLNYSLFSSSQCIAWCETSLGFHVHLKKEIENLLGWSSTS